MSFAISQGILTFLLGTIAFGGTLTLAIVRVRDLTDEHLDLLSIPFMIGVVLMIGGYLDIGSGAMQATVTAWVSQ